MAPLGMPSISFACNTFFKYSQLIKFKYRDAYILICILDAYILYVYSISKDIYICRYTEDKYYNVVVCEYNRFINMKYSHYSLVSMQSYCLSNGLKPVAAA